MSQTEKIRHNLYIRNFDKQLSDQFSGVCKMAGLKRSEVLALIISNWLKEKRWEILGKSI